MLKQISNSDGPQTALSPTLEWRQDQSSFQAYFFGPFRVHRGNSALDDSTPFARARVRTLLKWFLLHPQERYAAHALYALLWPDHPGAPELNRLHVTLHYLRRLLEPQLAPRQKSSFIHSDDTGRYWFESAGRWWTDIAAAEQHMKAANAAELGKLWDDAIRLYEPALRVYEQTFLPEDIFNPVFDDIRTTHDANRRLVEGNLLGLYLRTGRTHEALTCALSVLDQDPFAENAALAMAHLDIRQGNYGAARAHLSVHVDELRRGLGVAPSPAVHDLLRRVNHLDTQRPAFHGH